MPQITNMMLNPLKKEHLLNVPNIKANVITLNLEDAIAESRKVEALNNIVDFLSENITYSSKIVVRVNPLEQGGLREIEALNSYNFLAIRVPKVKSVDHVKRALKSIRDDKELHISLETKEAFYNIRDYRVDKRFTTANLGILDLLNSFALPQSTLIIGNATIDYILSKFLLDCQSIGIEPVSFMYQDYNNIEEFTKWCEKEKQMGFRSKACLGPKQVEVAKSIFEISREDIEKALNIKKIFENGKSSGNNGIMSDIYGFIDEPIYKDALLLVASKGE